MKSIEKTTIITSERSASIRVSNDEVYFKMLIGGRNANTNLRRVGLGMGVTEEVGDNLESILSYASEEERLTPEIIEAIAEAYDYVTIDERVTINQ